MKIAWLLLVGLITTAMIAGCGGGGGGGAAPVSEPIRQMQPGDEVIYATHSDGDVFLKDSIDKMVIQEDANPPVYGDRRLKILATFDTNGGGLSPDPDDELLQLEAFIEQDFDGTVYSIPHNKTPINEVGKPIDIPGTLQVGRKYSYSCAYAEGGTYTSTTQVVAVESMDGYLTYKLYTYAVSRGVDDIEYSTDSINSWVVPELGREIRSEITTKYDGKQTYTVRRLIEKNY